MLVVFGRSSQAATLVLPKRSRERQLTRWERGTRDIGSTQNPVLWILYRSAHSKKSILIDSGDSMRSYFPMRIMNLIHGCAKMAAKYGSIHRFDRNIMPERICLNWENNTGDMVFGKIECCANTQKACVGDKRYLHFL